MARMLVGRFALIPLIGFVDVRSGAVALNRCSERFACTGMALFPQLTSYQRGY